MKNERQSALQAEDKFMLRLPDGKRALFAAIAARNDRSLNMELVHRLEASLAVPADIAQLCNELGDVKDGLDFAVRLFRRAGIEVILTKNEN